MGVEAAFDWRGWLDGRPMRRHGMLSATTSPLVRLLPRRSDYAGLRGWWRGDLVAGLTVAIVALPLALGFGITTGLGANAGLITAIVAGLVAAICGGSNVQVSGPTGAMTVVLVPVVHRYGADAVPVIGIMVGLLVVAAAFARLGRYLALIPWPVIEGFTIGIALTIVLQQVSPALGVQTPAGDNAGVVAAMAVARALAAGSLAALGIVILVAATMTIVTRVHRRLPASLIAVVIATVVAEVAGLNVIRIGTLPHSLPMPSAPAVSWERITQLASPALAVALLAALESLLSAKVADGMVGSARHDPDRELFGQGMANLVSPFFGGMPATGAIARTAVNVRAGAKTRIAAASHSGVLILIVVFAGGLVARIPVAALAGVLIVTAFRMVHMPNVRAVLRATRSDAIVLVLTAATTVVFDLIVAVEIGVAVAAILALRNIATSASAVAEVIPTGAGIARTTAPDSDIGLSAGRIVTYRLDGALFFGDAHRFLTEMTAVTDVSVVILRMPQLKVLDATGAHSLGEIVRDLEHRGITVLIKGPRPEHLKVLAIVGALDRLAHENHIFTSLDEAVAHAHLHAARTPPVGAPHIAEACASAMVG